MTKIKYTQHFLNRSKIRKISKRKVKEALLNPDLKAEDLVNKTKIALKKLSGKFLVVVYVDNEEILIITCHYIKIQKVKNRIKSNRWKLIE